MAARSAIVSVTDNGPSDQESALTVMSDATAVNRPARQIVTPAGRPPVRRGHYLTGE